MSKPIYLDYNATTPLAREVIDAMLPFLEENFGNPSSSHYYGARTKHAVENARGQIAALMECDPAEIVFTSGGTESNNHAIKGIAFSRGDRGNHIITSQIEHPAVLEVCRFLEGRGFEITSLAVDEYGRVNPKELERALRPGTILISIMHANNEVGTIEPIEEISEIARRHGIPFHTDAAQSVGKIPTSVRSLGVDLLSMAGHKFYAPKGIGALYIRKGLELEKLIHGAGHEAGRRAGTENVASIVGLGQACEIAGRDLGKNRDHMQKMRDLLHKGIESRIGSARLNGHPEHRLPNTLSLSFHGIEAGALLSDVEEVVALSAGAACHSGGIEISHVLRAMNVPPEWAAGTIRFSTGRFTTEDEIARTIAALSGSNILQDHIADSLQRDR